jgi:hypothetical protein
MDIRKLLKRIKTAQAGFQLPQTVSTPPEPSPLNQVPPQISPTEAPQQPSPQPSGSMPPGGRRIYPTEFKKWFKFKGYYGGKKNYQILGYFLNIFEVDPNSPEGQQLASVGYKYSKEAFSKMVKTQEDVVAFEQELAQIEQATGCVFDTKWREEAKETFPGDAVVPDATQDEAMEAKIEEILASGELTNDRKKEISDKYIRAKLERLAEMSEEAQAEVVKQMLAVHDGFHNYSFVNRILMLIQNPNVTNFVAGKGAWENPNGALKRQVKEGEEPMQVFAPEQYWINLGQVEKILDAVKGFRETLGRDTKLGDSEYLAAQIGMSQWNVKHYLSYVFFMGGGKLDEMIRYMEKQVKDPMFRMYKRVYYGKKKNAFKMVPVYDINQTEPTGPDSFNIDEYEDKWLGSNAPDDVATALTAAAVEYAKTARYQIGDEWKTGINIDLSAMTGGAGGWSSGAEIAVRDMSQGWRQLGTVVHEIAHTLLHWGPERGKMGHRQREIEAEATLYVVLDYFGYQDLRFAANYVGLHKFTQQDVLDRYNAVHYAASNIIQGIRKIVETRQKGAGSWFSTIKYATVSLSRGGPIWVL